MTEIKIQRKKNFTPYLLVGTILLGALAYFSYNSYNKWIRNDQFIKSDHANVRENNPQVNAYLTFTAKGDFAITFNHTYINEALSKLADATGSLADELGFDIKKDIKSVKVITDRIDQNPFETSHSGDLRKAGDLITASLKTIQKVYFPGLLAEATEVQRTIAEINPQILTLDQSDQVNSFFKSAADLLQKMN